MLANHEMTAKSAYPYALHTSKLWGDRRCFEIPFSWRFKGSGFSENQGSSGLGFI